MSTFVSMVIHISPMQPYMLKGHMGKAIQELTKREILGTTLAAELDAKGDILPYTVSSLFELETMRHAQGALRSESAVWFRVTGIGGTPLGDDTVAALERWAGAHPALIEIDRAAWRVHTILTTAEQHPWATRLTLSDLQARYQQHVRVDAIRFKFVSPTTFHTESRYVPLPMPGLVYRKLIDAWQKLMPIPLDEHLPLFAQQFMQIKEHHLDTYSILLKNEPFIGFTGETLFTIERSNEGLARRQPEVYAAIDSQYESLSQWLGLLAEFAFFCGVGVKTASGMGMVRATPHLRETAPKKPEPHP